MEIQPVDSTQIVVALITASASIFTAVLSRDPSAFDKLIGRRTPKKPREPADNPSPRLNPWMLATVFCFALFALNAGLIARPYLQSPMVKITYPTSGGYVQVREVVRGASQNVSHDRQIWVVVYVHSVNRYYPQDGPADVQANGDWARQAQMGLEKESGHVFDIVAVVADKKAQDVFLGYLQQAKEKSSYEGIERLPDGAIIYDRIKVTRQ